MAKQELERLGVAAPQRVGAEVGLFPGPGRQAVALHARRVIPIFRPSKPGAVIAMGLLAMRPDISLLD
jgi:hypothetical protein